VNMNLKPESKSLLVTLWRSDLAAVPGTRVQFLWDGDQEVPLPYSGQRAKLWVLQPGTGRAEWSHHEWTADPCLPSQLMDVEMVEHKQAPVLAEAPIAAW
ncbi:hypothetical protein EK904_001296, partial [Melospiza melodia maxima]